VAAALRNLSVNDEYCVMIASAGGIPPLIALLVSPSACSGMLRAYLPTCA
jgi:hypothetical protein